MIIIKEYREVADEVRKHLKEYLELNRVEFRGRDFRCISHEHEDKNPSAGLTKDGLVFVCNGCGIRGDIFSAYRIFTGKEIKGEQFFYALKELADLFNVPYVLDDNKKIKYVEEKEYIYESSDGVEIYKIKRYHKEDENGNILIKGDGKIDKTFSVHTKVEGIWEKGMKINTRYLYNLPSVSEAICNNEEIYVVEGEKCADILNKEFGVTCTTIPFGSNAWKLPYSTDYKNQLQNAKVVLIPDNDKCGYQLMNDILRDIKRTVKSIKLVNLNNDIPLPDKGDIEQWMGLGGTKDRLIKLVQSSKDLSDTIKPWYITDEKGKVKINTGLLAKHLVEGYPSLNCAGIFYLYTNGVYKKCKSSVIHGLIKEKIDDEFLRMNIIKDVEGLWAIDKSIVKNPEELNSNPNIINVKNGLFDVVTGEFKRHDYKFHSTVQLNVLYNNKAKGEVFPNFLDSIVPEKENQDILQEMAGYAMSMYNKAKKIFIIQGPRDSGKTTFLNIISEIIGEDYLSHIELQNLGERFNKAVLFGKLANIASELPDREISDSGFIKALVGQNEITAEYKGKDPFSFVNKAKLLFACNKLPNNYGDKSDDFFNKIIVIQFKRKLKDDEIDVMLPEKLQNEKEYIFLWAMEGLKRLINNGFRFTETANTRQIVENYRISTNNILEFIQEKCLFEPNAEVLSTKLFEEYNNYCKQNNYKPVGRNKFKIEIESSFSGIITPKLITKDRLSGYVGIMLK